jgi:hypothetical protein
MLRRHEHESLNLNKETSEPKDTLLLFEKVKNKVAYVNDEINAPLKLEKGEESPLGLFAKAAFDKEHELKPDEQRLESWPEHHRSALLGKVIFNDKDGRLYRDIDVKGIGYINRNQVLEPGKRYSTIGEIPKIYMGTGEYGGFLKREEAFDEHIAQEKLLEAGVRTGRTLAIIDIEEIVFNGEKFSLDEARAKKIIRPDYDDVIDPVIEVRAFGTKARIRDICESKKENKNKELKKFLLEDAKKLVSQETGKDLSLDKSYLKWFAKTLGENVALMHKNGLRHRYLGDHNITLDCRIVDTCNVRNIKNKKERMRDISWAKKSLKVLVQSLKFDKNFSEFENQFSESYDNIFLPDSVKKRQRQQISSHP